MGEKFLLLVRRYLGATFKILKEGGWGESLVKSHVELLREVPCNVTDVRVPNGMRFHVIDIYVDELERAGLFEEEGKEEALEDERLPGNVKVEGEAPEEDDGWGGFKD